MIMRIFAGLTSNLTNASERCEANRYILEWFA